MRKSYSRVTIPVLLAALAALSGCEGALSMQQGGPNMNTTSPDPLPDPPEIDPDEGDEASIREKLFG